MKLDLRNDIKDRDPKMFEKGVSAWKRECVQHCMETEEGVWSAEVKGYTTYLTTVKIIDNKVRYWQCGCPFMGSICKHVVASVLEIEKMINENDHSTLRTRSIADMVDEMSHSELKELVKRCADENIEFAAKLKENLK